MSAVKVAGSVAVVMISPVPVWVSRRRAGQPYQDGRLSVLGTVGGWVGERSREAGEGARQRAVVVQHELTAPVQRPQCNLIAVRESVTDAPAHHAFHVLLAV